VKHGKTNLIVACLRGTATLQIKDVSLSIGLFFFIFVVVSEIRLYKLGIKYFFKELLLLKMMRWQIVDFSNTI
jgi:hypothetical protein